MAKRQISGSRAIVTGASSGIGRELARQLAAEGADVVLVARRRQRLEQLAAEIGSGGPKVEIVAGDLTDPAVRRAAIETARTKLGGLDILVNNAGVGAMGRFKDADPDRVRRVMEVNFFALVEMTRLALPLLGQGNDPVIVNVSSILGHRGIPQMSEYSASKFAVQGFSESLRAELAGGPIGLLVVSPGTTETEFFDSVVQKTGEPAFPEHRAVPPAKVARETLRAIRSRRNEITPYFWGKALCWLNRLSPRLMDWYLARFG